MLQAIRDKITGWIAAAFLIVIAIVFVFWGIDFGASATSYAAKVDGESIPLEQVRRAWQQRRSQLQQMLRDELPPEMVKQQQTALLDQFVQQQLLTQRASDFGYSVTDSALADRVMQIDAFHVDGQFSKDRYNAMLRSSGLNEAQFEADLRNELLVEQIQSGVIDSSFVTARELSARYALERQQREVAYALIPASDFTASAVVTDEHIQKWYDEHRDQFLTPETADLQYVEITRPAAEAKVSVTDEALRDYYNQNKERFESAERRRARHILITADEKLSEEAAQKLADDLAAKAKGGADFAQLAKENSKDPGSAAQGGDLGWAQKGMFVGPFEDALFSMTAGEIRGPVKTQFGHHIIKLEEIESGRMKTFEEARTELEDEFRRDRAQSLFYDESQKLADLAFSSLTELDSVAKTLNLPVKTVKGFTRQGGDEFGADRAVIDAVFSEDVLDKRENSPLLTVGEDRAVVLRVVDHKPAEPRPLAEVRPQIEAQLRIQAARDAAQTKGQDVLARLQKGEALADVARAANLSLVDKRFVTRTDAVVPEAVARAAFTAPRAQLGPEKPWYGGVTTDDGNYAVLAVTQVRNGEPSAEPAQEQNARRRRLERQLGNEEFAAYVAEAERNADVVKNDKAFE